MAAEGIRGSRCIRSRRVRVTFPLMVNWDKIFGKVHRAVKETEKTSEGVEVRKNPCMMTILPLWITFLDRDSSVNA